MKKVIALDEMGKFEDYSSGICFVGGYTLPIMDHKDNARQIEMLLKTFCDEFNSMHMSNFPDARVYYPYSLHGSGTTFFRKHPTTTTCFDETIANKEKQHEWRAKEFQERLEERIVQYILHQQGTLYVYLDPFVGGAQAERDSYGNANIIHETHGANIYERMATLCVYDQTFFTPNQDCSEFFYELATRTLTTKEDGWDELYDVYATARNNSKKSPITNTSTYKTAVASMLYSGSVPDEYLNKQYRFHVKSINYTKHTETTPHLYLADIICGYVRRKLQKFFSVNINTRQNSITAEGLIEFCRSTKIQVKVFDNCDKIYRNMVRALQKWDLGEFYQLKYQLTCSSYYYRDFYLSYWVADLEKNLFEMLTDSVFRNKIKGRIPEFVDYADGFMGKRETSYETGLYIATCLIQVVLAVPEYPSRNLMLFRLYDILLRGYNHRGALDETQKYILKCDEYKSAVGLEEYIAHVLRVLVFYFNALNYEKALTESLKLEETISLLKKTYQSAYIASSKISKTITNEKTGMPNYQFPLAGKVYSSIGQAYGFLGDFRNSKKYFLKALKEFDIGSTNYSITMSHFLQLLITHRKKAEYELYANLYFGAHDLWTKLESAFSRRDGGFAILIFVKAFQAFYAKDSANGDILVEMIDRIEKCPYKGEHPWELIYKNLYEAIAKQHRAVAKNDYLYIKERAVKGLQSADATIGMIQIHSKLSFEDMPESLLVGEVLSDIELSYCRIFIQDVERMSVYDLKTWCNTHLTYSYQ